MINIPEVKKLREEAIRRWRAMGFDEELIKMAMKLADKWIFKMSGFFTGYDDKYFYELIKRNYKYAIMTAEKWLMEMSK